MQPAPRIALLSTGDELTQGEVANTNGQVIARSLTDHGYLVGDHMTATDDESDIISAIQFLLQTHQVIIITGGLGPTVDDRTRYALAKAVDKPLMFDPHSWQCIQDTFKHLQIIMHDSNKSQAYFPEGAKIFDNFHGTARGCRVVVNQQVIYMLPGPPHECMPMFEHAVLPDLADHMPIAPIQLVRWRLFGIGESTIAPRIEALIKNSECQTAYRVDYPYLDVKLRAESDFDMREVQEKIGKLVEPYIICQATSTASRTLKQTLRELSDAIHIEDHVTNGGLQQQLIDPTTHAKCQFVSAPPTSKGKAYFLISGLEPYWQGAAAGGQLEMTLHVQLCNNQYTKTFNIPFRHKRVMPYVIELLAYHINQGIKS